MARSFSSLIDPERDKITLRNALTADIIPWLIGAGFIVVLFLGIVLMAQEMLGDKEGAFEIAAATASGAPFLMWGLLPLGCIIARRAYREVYTWVLAVFIVIFFAHPAWYSLSVQLFPNSVLPAMTAMVGVLALGRLFEYGYAHFGAKLAIKMSGEALATYLVLFLGALFLLLPGVPLMLQ